MGRAPKRERVLTAGTAYPPVAIGRYVATAPCGCRAPTRAPLRRASSIGYCCILGGTNPPSGPAVSPLRLALALACSSGGSACRALPLHFASVMQRVAFWSCILHAACCTLHAACCMLHCCMLHVACCTAARRQRRVPLRREPAELCCLLSLHSVRPCLRPPAALNRTLLPFHCNHCSADADCSARFPSPPPALGGSHGNTSPQ